MPVKKKSSKRSTKKPTRSFVPILSKSGFGKVVVKYKRDLGATTPEYAYPGDAGLDIFANENKILKPMHRALVRTGLYLELPEGYAGLVWDKGSVPIRFGLHTLAGVLDCNYRGELKVVAINLSSRSIKITKGMKIAQLLIQKVEKAELKEEELSKTERGTKGFGSSGSGLKDIKREIMS